MQHMTPPIPLHGAELIDCARANAKLGIVQAAYYCGYDGEIDEFQRELENACHQMGLDIDTLAELSLTESNLGSKEVAPKTLNQI
jgi:hypothetical protein